MPHESPTNEVEAWQDVDNHLKRYGRVGRKPQTLKAVINKVLVKRGYNQRQGNMAIAEAWREAVPQRWVANCQVGGVRRGTLSIVVDNSATLQQLTFIQQQLLKNLQQKLTETTIKNLRFTLG